MAKLSRVVVRVALSAFVLLDLGGAMRSFGAELYFGARSDDDPGNVIVRAGLDGAASVEVVSAIQECLAGFAIDPAAGKLYWVRRGVEDSLQWADLDGARIETIVTSPGNLGTVAVDPVGGKIYFTQFNVAASGIYRADLDGSNPELFSEEPAAHMAIDSVHGRLYRTISNRRGGAEVAAHELESGVIEEIATITSSTVPGIALDVEGAKIYWAYVDYSRQVQVVERANLDGSDVESLIVANPGLDDWPSHVAVDAAGGKLYFGNAEDGEIYRAGLDGSEVELLFTVQELAGLVLDLSVQPPLPQFVRGDCNDDGSVDISDGVCVLNRLFLGGKTPVCVAATNANGDGTADISDATYLLNHLFLGGPPPVAPFLDCGTSDLPADEALGCEEPSQHCR